MGFGIAQIVASNGCHVRVYDVGDAYVDKARENMKQSLRKFWEKKKLSESPEQVLKRLSWDTVLRSMADVDFIIEAVPV